MNISDRAKSLLSYWDRAICILVFIYALSAHLEAVAITFALLTIIGGQRIQSFILALLIKIEQSEEVSIGALSCKRSEAASLPKDSLNIERLSGTLWEFPDYLNKGTACIQQGNFEEAKIWLDKAVEANPDSYEVHTQLGLLYDLRKEYQKSIDHSKRALEIKLGAFTPQFNLAVATNHLYGADKSLLEYLKAEEFAREAGIGEEIVIGKLNLFLGHDYRDKQERNKALERYYRARDIFKGFNTTEAHYWLRDANSNIRILEGM